ncbi:30S ribosomal protein S20 [Kamptonema cortianum]|nr:30S ribosomal protein S20 [Oscillatoria laete-virens]MDK3160233.1 30S ribosomal protein S20 [Kamptonema cortianum]MDL5048413.1 30S ribosomal protein S20 [Oscillatoria amoena NRMC-F 0135]MDL5055675.1 30S ribosomal protein S20 [Oscillatoria laete-virens NRMC-F 0139]
MPNIKSAIKHTRSDKRKAAYNSKAKEKVKSARKEFIKLVEAGNKDEAAKAISKVASALDKAAKRGTIHKNKASRIKSRLAKRLK